jgi:putative PEP-CTERM system TPR-repeat lipoprotein
MHTRSCARLLAVSVLAAAALAACGGGNPEQQLAAAKEHLATGELRTASIEVKTALRKRPDWADARFLLGKVLLESEEPVGAAVELRKALDLKHPRDAVVPLLADAMLRQGQQRQLIGEFANETLTDRVAQATLKTTLAWAYMAGEQWTLAEGALTQALESQPGHVPAMVARARMTAVRGDRDGAEKSIDSVISAGKPDADTWVLKGDLRANAGDVDGAIGAYRKALVMSNVSTHAHAGIVSLLLQKRDIDGASAQLAEMQKARPGNPTASLLQAQIAYEKKDYKTAKELIQGLLKGAPGHPMVNQLAGAIELVSGSNEAARAYLAKAVQAAPQNAVARRLLAAAHIASGESVKGLATLEPLLASTPDAIVLALAGQAHMQNGDLDKASAAFAQAVKASPTPENRTALARMRSLKGDALGAVADLQQIAAQDTGTTADLELVNTQLRRRDYKGAIVAIDALDKKMPGKALPAHLRGTAHLGLKEKTQAREQFGKALAADAAYFPAAASLAALDLEDKQPQAAQQRFDAVLKAQPGHLQAMLALAGLRARGGGSVKDVTELLNEAVRLNGSQAAAHLALIDYLLSVRQPEQALTAAQRAEAALPSEAVVIDALGRAQMASGQTNQALSTYNRLATLKPDQAAAHMRLADASLANKDTKSALQSLERAVALKPDSPALPKLFALQLKEGKAADALALARDAQRRHPDMAMGFLMEGDVLQVQKNQGAAMAAYERALAKAPLGAGAAKVHELLAASGKAAEANQFAENWNKKNPNDVLFASYLGDRALSAGDMAGAEAAFERVIAIQPNHVIALNNVAWLKAKAGKPGALALAEKANGLQPNVAFLMDTLAVALAADKQVDKAIEVQKKVVELAPDEPTFRLGLARMYVQAGQKAPARELLDALDKLGDKFKDQAEVKRLLGTL